MAAFLSIRVWQEYGRVDQYRTEQALVADEHRGHAVAAGVDHLLVLDADLVVGTLVGDGFIDECGVEADLCDEVPGNIGFMGTKAIFVQCSASPFVPVVEIVHAGSAKQSANPKHRPSVGPLTLPRMLLSLDAVHFFEAEELPIDLDAVLGSDVANPLGRLIGVGAHDVEMKVNCCHLGLHGASVGVGPV